MTTTGDLMDRAMRGTIHFMGASGAGMAPLAELILRGGGQVSGCDLRITETAQGLAAQGARILEGHDPAHVEGATALVVTSAVPPDHPELQAAHAAGIPVLKRAQALGALVNRGRVVAIAGTHGKTTTTAMTTQVLEAAGMDPTGLVGGHVQAWDGNLRYGGSDLFVVEADEYDRSFHTLEPDVAVVTNLEGDHLDIYGDLAGVEASFRQFAEAIRGDGPLLFCADDSGAARLAAGFGSRARGFGVSAGSQVRATDLVPQRGGTRFTVHEDGARVAELMLPFPGLHNVRNALAAACVCRELGGRWDQIAEGLRGFSGVGRRLQLLGDAAGATVIDDYAHHPTEIVATCEALRASYPERRLVVVFQPHLFSRTRDFSDAFGEALAGFDVAWVTDVYPAREAPIPGVTGALVHEAALRSGADARYHEDLTTLADAVVGDIRDGDVCVTMGAGSIDSVGPQILTALMETHDAPA